MSDTTTNRRRTAAGRIRRHVAVLALAVAVTATGAVTVAAADSPAPAAPQRDSDRGGQVLHFDVRFSPFNVIDVPPLQRRPGDYQPGDYSVFSDRLINQAGATVGRQAGSGLITRVGATGAEVYFSLAVRLRDGQIAAQGLSSTAPRKRLAVVGGTGAYTGAAGHLDLVEHGNGTGTLTITLRSPDKDR